MANMKTISLIAAEIGKEAGERRLDIVHLIEIIEDEMYKIRKDMNKLEERVDILEHE